MFALTAAFNACNGGVSSGFQSATLASVSCKLGLEKGVLSTLAHDDLPRPFALTKVPIEDANVQGKTTAARIDAGTELGILFDNDCLRSAPGLATLSQVAVASGQMRPLLDRQVYTWRADRDYQSAELEAIAQADACVIGVAKNRTYSIQSTTLSDPNNAQQAHFAATRAYQAYDAFYPTGGGGIPRAGGTPVVVAVADTGTELGHPDLAGNLWSHSQGYGIDITTLNTSAVNYYPNDVSSNGHGTHVAGLIGAIANNGIGTAGLMPFNVKIMPIKVFTRAANGDLSTTSQYFYNALRFAYLNGASVINLSLGSVSTGAASDALALQGVSEAVANGTTVIVVIGNADTGDGQLINGTTMSSIPGQYAANAGVIGVGSIDAATGAKSYFSHYSPTFAEIAAPGAENGSSGILSTLPTTLGGYGRLAGTSQAGPLVAAAAALTVGMIKAHYTVAPTPAEVERLVLAGSVKVPGLTTYFKDGNRLDLANLATKIMTEYPGTRGAGVVNVGACD